MSTCSAFCAACAGVVLPAPACWRQWQFWWRQVAVLNFCARRWLLWALAAPLCAPRSARYAPTRRRAAMPRARCDGGGRPAPQLRCAAAHARMPLARLLRACVCFPALTRTDASSARTSALRSAGGECTAPKRRVTVRSSPRAATRRCCQQPPSLTPPPGHRAPVDTLETDARAADLLACARRSVCTGTPSRSDGRARHAAQVRSAAPAAGSCTLGGVACTWQRAAARLPSGSVGLVLQSMYLCRAAALVPLLYLHLEVACAAHLRRNRLVRSTPAPAACLACALPPRLMSGCLRGYSMHLPSSCRRRPWHRCLRCVTRLGVSRSSASSSAPH